MNNQMNQMRQKETKRYLTEQLELINVTEHEYTFNTKGKSEAAYTRGECPRCKTLIFRRDGETLKILGLDRCKKAITLGGAIFTGVGIGNYMQSLRFEDASIGGSYVGHIFMVLGFVLFSLVLFRGTAWQRDYKGRNWVKVIGMVAFVSSGLLGVIGLGCMNGSTENVAGGVDVEMLQDIAWTDMFSGGNAGAAGAVGGALALFCLSMLALFFVHQNGRSCDAHGKYYFGSAVFNTLGVVSVIASIAVFSDTLIRVRDLKGNVDAEQYDADLGMDSLDIVNNGTFGLLGTALSFMMFWVCWTLFRPVLFGDNGDKVYNNFQRTYAVLATATAITSMCLGVQSMISYQGEQINAAQIPDVGLVADNYGGTGLAAGIIFVAAIAFALLAKNKHCLNN